VVESQGPVSVGEDPLAEVESLLEPSGLDAGVARPRAHLPPTSPAPLQRAPYVRPTQVASWARTGFGQARWCLVSRLGG
jgi:hypothetical protein